MAYSEYTKWGARVWSPSGVHSGRGSEGLRPPETEAYLLTNAYVFGVLEEHRTLLNKPTLPTGPLKGASHQ